MSPSLHCRTSNSLGSLCLPLSGLLCCSVQPWYDAAASKRHSPATPRAMFRCRGTLRWRPPVTFSSCFAFFSIFSFLCNAANSLALSWNYFGYKGDRNRLHLMLETDLWHRCAKPSASLTWKYVQRRGPGVVNTGSVCWIQRKFDWRFVVSKLMFPSGLKYACEGSGVCECVWTSIVNSLDMTGKSSSSLMKKSSEWVSVLP